MSFRVGQKVVCVAEFKLAAMFPETAFPKKGVTYTVRSLTKAGNAPGLRVREIVNRKVTHSNGVFCEPTFIRTAFRPLMERTTETGMAILREILDRESDGQPAKPKTVTA